MDQTLEPFKIPEPYKAWCHLCNQGFTNIYELGRHNYEMLREHQKITAASGKNGVK